MDDVSLQQYVPVSEFVRNNYERLGFQHGMRQGVVTLIPQGVPNMMFSVGMEAGVEVLTVYVHQYPSEFPNWLFKLLTEHNAATAACVEPKRALVIQYMLEPYLPLTAS